MATKKKEVPVKENKKPEIEWEDITSETVAYKINWIGIRRKIIAIGELIKVHDMQLPEIKFVYSIWNEYCKWWNREINKIPEPEYVEEEEEYNGK